MRSIPYFNGGYAYFYQDSNMEYGVVPPNFIRIKIWGNSVTNKYRSSLEIMIILL